MVAKDSPKRFISLYLVRKLAAIVGGLFVSTGKVADQISATNLITGKRSTSLCPIFLKL